MTLKVPYTDNLTTNAKLPGQIAVDMKAIEHEDLQDDQALAKEAQDREDADKKLDGRIDDANNRMDQLNQEKATHDDVNDLRDELLKKIKHIILGTDEETVKTVIQEMKKEGTI
ncbi:MAG: hypothetical protein ACI4UB_02575 [Limosilactobacillus sp.]